MLALSTSFQNHLNQEVTTIAMCVRLTRLDGVVLAFTSLDSDITIDGVSYKATDSLNASLAQMSADLRVDNLDVQGVLTDDRITDEELLSGKYDNAQVDIFLVNWASLPADLNDKTNMRFLMSCEVGEIRVSGSFFYAEMRSLKERLAKQHMEVFGPLCRAKRLGDARCKRSLTSFTFSYTVSSVTSSRRSFTHSSTAQVNDYFKYGVIRWTSGLNNGTETVCKEYASGVITLVEKMFFDVQVGDAFTAIRGCDRQFSTCRDTFNNVKNFRGEPPHLMPGNDKLIYPLQ